MKAKILNAVLICTLLFAGCKPPKEEIKYYDLSNDVVYISFKDLYMSAQDDRVFFIEGLALNIYEYGRHIEVIQDLKGNFADTSLIYVQKVDAITQYNKNDTLIMLIEKVYKENDYIAGGCAVLKLSNSYVTGYINNDYFSGHINKEETMLWEDLQKELQELLNETKKSKP